MKKFFQIAKYIAVFSAGSFVAVAAEYGFCAEAVCGLVAAALVYGLASVAERRVPEEATEE